MAPFVAPLARSLLVQVNRCMYAGAGARARDITRVDATYVRGHDRRGTPPTGGPHRGDGPTEDPPPEGGGTQGTHTEHTQTVCISTLPYIHRLCIRLLNLCARV